MRAAGDGERAAWSELSATYAAAADDRDGARYASVFAEDGELVMMLDGPDRPPSGIRRGREELAGVADLLGRFSATHHQLGQARYWLDGEGRGGGEVYCTATHLMQGGTLTMFIRYRDRYVRDAAGEWLIARREVVATGQTRTP